jgi:6-phosphofructokinase 1
MNTVIREIVYTLYRYGATTVYGIRNGFGGLVDDAMWVKLTIDDVQDIHSIGGSILQVHSGWHSIEAGAAALLRRNAKQFFALGGDGTIKGTLQLLTALTKKGHECACVGVPLTIDNNIPLVDSTLGFDTACTIARQAINAAYVEATCNANCIGFVKFTGQKSGFLAMHTTLASRHVNVCLLPEMETSPEKVMAHCEDLMKTQGYAVVVVAEGVGESMFRLAGETDTSKDVGYWLRDKILAHFKGKGLPLTIKYIDPTHMVKAYPPNTSDSVYCSTIGEDAVHGAMAGYTGIAAVKLYERHIYMPISVIAELPARKVLPQGRWCSRMLFTTKQPSFAPDGFEYPAPSSGIIEALLRCSTPVTASSLLNPGSELVRLNSANLAATFPSKQVANPVMKSAGGTAMTANSWSSQCWTRRNAADTGPGSFVQLLRAGQRELLHFDPQEPGAAAALVTCGGLCPGLNSVIREVASMLRKYGVQKIYGIIGGYQGCVKPDEWIDLTTDVIQDIHMMGGSILVSDRGNPPPEDIAKTLQSRNVRQFFVLGGDGTHAGAMETFTAMTAIKHECAVVGVPKTIDNDIQLLDRSFGFDTACTEAKNAIDSAYVESSTNANCIGLVKLMGRHCGWIALMASLAARTVDVCLIPEMSVSLPKLLDYVVDVMKRKKKAVIVVAEGCGDTILQSCGARDAGGNKVLADVGPYLKDEITKYCKAKAVPVTIKYIDPTYMIRSVAANAKDSEYSAMLGQMAVHGAMAGYTGITVGKVDERFVMLPIHAIAGKGSRKVDVSSRFFERLMATTLQPSFEP